MATRETLASFQGRSNVTKITSDNGMVNYLTSSMSFEEQANNLGANGLVTYENEHKHVLFLFSGNTEVGRFYLGKNLQGKSSEELVAQKSHILFFESWNPETKAWVPCAGYSNQESLASKVVRF